MNLPLFQAKSAVLTALIVSVCLISSGANAAGPKPATAKQKVAWENEWSEKVGVALEYDLDSSGPDAWDAEEHPLVFITTEGPGYGGLLSGVTLPGLAIIDATEFNNPIVLGQLDLGTHCVQPRIPCHDQVALGGLPFAPFASEGDVAVDRVVAEAFLLKVGHGRELYPPGSER